jgi:hypothetical protein
MDAKVECNKQVCTPEKEGNLFRDKEFIWNKIKYELPLKKGECDQ